MANLCLIFKTYKLSSN